MNTTDRHPDTGLLDRLRAGLLDQDPARKSQLEAHLEHCEACRRRALMVTRLQSDALDAEELEQRLDRARQRAMQMPVRRAPLPRLALPFAGAAAVALLAVVLVWPLQQEQSSQPQVAESSTAVEVPELYEELDFYLWLADHKARSGDSAT